MSTKPKNIDTSGEHVDDAFTDGQLAIVSAQELDSRYCNCGPDDVGEVVWAWTAARLILQARAERDEWKQRHGEAERRTLDYIKFLHKAELARDAALARVRELERELGLSKASLAVQMRANSHSGATEFRERIAELEAENAKLKYYDIRGACLPFIPNERIATLEALEAENAKLELEVRRLFDVGDILSASVKCYEAENVKLRLALDTEKMSRPYWTAERITENERLRVAFDAIPKCGVCNDTGTFSDGYGMDCWRCDGSRRR